MQDLMQKLTGNLIDLLIYGAIAAVCRRGLSSVQSFAAPARGRCDALCTGWK